MGTPCKSDGEDIGNWTWNIQRSTVDDTSSKSIDSEEANHNTYANQYR